MLVKLVGFNSTDLHTVIQNVNLLILKAFVVDHSDIFRCKQSHNFISYFNN